MNRDRADDPAPDNFTAVSIAYVTAFAFSRGVSPVQVAQQLRSVYGDRVPGGAARYLDEHRPEWRVCSIEGCDRPKKARGWCGAHYERWRLWGDPTFYPSRQKQKQKPDPPAPEAIRAEMDKALDEALQRGRETMP